MTNILVSNEELVNESKLKLEFLLNSLYKERADSENNELPQAPELRNAILILENIKRYLDGLASQASSKEQKKILDFFYFYLQALEVASPDSDLKINTLKDLKEFHCISEANTEYPKELDRISLFININILLILSLIATVATVFITLCAIIILASLPLAFSPIALGVTTGAVSIIGFTVTTLLFISLTLFTAKIMDYQDLIKNEKDLFCNTLNDIASKEIETTSTGINQRKKEVSLDIPLVFFNSHPKSQQSQKSARKSAYEQTEEPDELVEQSAP